MANIRLTASIVISGFVVLASCTRVDNEKDAFEQGMEHFWANEMTAALPLFERAVIEEGEDPQVHVWLAETLRRVRRYDEAIAEAAIALELEPCNTFAHTVTADALVAVADLDSPAEFSEPWAHLTTAIECDSTDGNAWESLWGIAIRRSEPQTVRRSEMKMAETGFLTGAVLSFGRWLLVDLPPDAILITNGDIDTFSASTIQATEGIREDVAVVERGLLNTTWGRRFYRDHSGVTFPFTGEDLDGLTAIEQADGSRLDPEDQILAEWVEATKNGSSMRPVALAATVYRDFFEGVDAFLQYAGPFWLVVPPGSAAADTVVLRRSLDRIVSGSFSGPWSGEQDYSPIRRAQTPGIVRGVTYSALVLAEKMIENGRIEDARSYLQWAEDFERETLLGPSYGDRIAELRSAAAGRE